jgi:hypothetical protein
MRHHDSEAEDVVEGEAFMGAIERLEESTSHQKNVVGVLNECPDSQVFIEKVLCNNNAAKPDGQKHGIGYGAKPLVL